MTEPRFRRDHHGLAWLARYLHQQRVDGYPGLIQAGTLAPAAARRALRISGTLAADWAAIAAIEPSPEWIADPERGGALKWERVETLMAMAIRTRTESDAYPENPTLLELADGVDALLWWERQQFSARFFADLTIELRARAAPCHPRTAGALT